jgi:hypothetical protein
MITLTQEEYGALGRQLMLDCQSLTSHEAASQHITETLYNRVQSDGEPAFALVRIYRLTRVEELPPDLSALTEPADQFVMALTGTYGQEEAWRQRKDSVGHKFVSLTKIAIPAKIPMFEQLLVRDMGVDLETLHGTRDVLKSAKASGGTFYIENVPESPVIPAQDQFVKPYSVKSLVGFGGVIAGADRRATLYSLIGFSRVPFTEAMAKDFQSMQVFVGTALASKREQAIFAEPVP